MYKSMTIFDFPNSHDQTYLSKWDAMINVSRGNCFHGGLRTASWKVLDPIGMTFQVGQIIGLLNPQLSCRSGVGGLRWACDALEDEGLSVEGFQLIGFFFSWFACFDLQTCQNLFRRGHF